MKIRKYNVIDTTYHLHLEADGSSIVEVRYAVEIRNGERLRCFSEYLNFENKLMKAAARCWWEDRSPDPLPETNQHAVDIANYHGVDMPRWIEVAYNGMGYNIVDMGLKKTAISKEEIEHGSKQQAGVCRVE
jgi:hypothetical protein